MKINVPSHCNRMLTLTIQTLADRPLKQAFELGPSHRYVDRINHRARANDKINTNNGCTGLTKDIPCQALESVPRYRPLHDALAHDNTQTRRNSAAGFYKYLEPTPSKPAFIGKYRRKSIRPIKPPPPGKRKIFFSDQALNGQAGAAFSAPGANHSATCTSPHAHPETVRAFTSRRRRLVSPFHNIRPVNVKSPLLQPLTPFSVNRHRGQQLRAAGSGRLWITLHKNVKLQDPLGGHSRCENHLIDQAHR